MRNWLKISLVFVGTVIGAGFASGQEILRFFVLYGKESVCGLVISGILFGLICACVLCKTYETGARNADEYFSNTAGRLLKAFLNIVMSLFMLSSFCVMVAGSGALFYEQLGLPMWLGIIVMCLACGFIFFRDVRGIVELNVYLTPVMIVGIPVLGAFAFAANTAEVFSVSGEVLIRNWLSASIIYVSYNTLTVTAVMTALHGMIDSRAIAIKASACSGVVLFVMAAVLWYILFVFGTGGAELPMLHAAGRISPVAAVLYIPILYIAMLTTAVSSGFGVIWSVKSCLGISERTAAVILCAVGGAVGFSGFSVLVERLYSFFGIIGIGAMVLIIADGVKYLRVRKIKKSKAKLKKDKNTAIKSEI